ncbi:MAG: LLM class flavin-dependent oxidoreductase, partial [Chloroflexi bacterium]
DQLEEYAEALRLLFDRRRADFDGTHFRLVDAPNNPKPIQTRLPLWIGGAGEKRTLRTAARFADGWNAPYLPPAEWKRKSQVLDAWCAKVGRDPSAIVRTINVGFYMGADESGAKRHEALYQKHWSKDTRGMTGFLRGTPRAPAVTRTRASARHSPLSCSRTIRNGFSTTTPGASVKCTGRVTSAAAPGAISISSSVAAVRNCECGCWALCNRTARSPSFPIRQRTVQLPSAPSVVNGSTRRRGPVLIAGRRGGRALAAATAAVSAGGAADGGNDHDDQNRDDHLTHKTTSSWLHANCGMTSAANASRASQS